ncbi:MAG: response regulator [Deltaproteobacteria bacterium]|nr:MAG: response regulator [Deltaproteobacteria bacterium]
MFGSRPSASTMRRYSSSVSPCWATICGVTATFIVRARIAKRNGRSCGSHETLRNLSGRRNGAGPRSRRAQRRRGPAPPRSGAAPARPRRRHRHPPRLRWARRDRAAPPHRRQGHRSVRRLVRFLARRQGRDPPPGRRVPSRCAPAGTGGAGESARSPEAVGCGARGDQRSLAEAAPGLRGDQRRDAAGRPALRRGVRRHEGDRSRLGDRGPAPPGTGGRRYTSDDVDFVAAIAARAALAVRNVRLVRQLAEERDRLDVARAQAEQRAAEMVAVFQADPNGIAIFDAAGVLRFVSPRVDELFGTKLDEFIGKHYHEAFNVDLRGDGQNRGRAQEMRSVFADRDSPSTDEFYLGKTSRWIRRSSAPMRSPSGTYLGRMFVYVDVTAEKELDRERSEFLTVAAHELRTPLTPLSMYLQGIERRLKRGSTIEPELIEKARRQVRRLSRLVEDLLDVSRLESGRLHLSRDVVEVDDLVAEVVADFQAASPHHEIVFRRPEQKLRALGDRERLEQVVVNLVQNAIKYSPHGGRVEVSVDRAGAQARVEVTDQGIGIPKEEQKHVFERFFRAHNAATRNYGGLGIGLYVSKEIVERHGGAVEVASEPGKGAKFAFTVPLDELGLVVPGGSARILIVDDDRAMLDATSTVLREWGYGVDEAADGETALRLLRATKPDLMLVDLMMPVMDGWTLVLRMRQQGLGEAIPLVIFTADRDAQARARELNAAAALRKPFSLEELQDVLGRVLPAAPPA